MYADCDWHVDSGEQAPVIQGPVEQFLTTRLVCLLHIMRWRVYLSIRQVIHRRFISIKLKITCAIVMCNKPHMQEGIE